RPTDGGWARVDPHVPAALLVPPLVQHGGQPRRLGRAAHGPRDPRVLVRAVPGRPRGRRPRPTGAPQRGGAAGVPRGDDLPPRGLRGVLGPAAGALRPRG